MYFVAIHVISLSQAQRSDLVRIEHHNQVKNTNRFISRIRGLGSTSADLDTQLMQLKHCDGE